MAALSPSLFSHYPVETAARGTWLLRRSQPCSTVVFVEAGRVALGIAGVNAPGNVSSNVTGNVTGTAAELTGAHAEAGLVHHLGTVQGPRWLEASAPVLGLPSAIDARAETEVSLRHIPLAAFRAVLSTDPQALREVLADVAHAHRQQTDLAVSRLAKDAEARCAEWLLGQARNDDKGVCSVRLQQRKNLIATQLGIAPETLSRVLRHLRERHFISGSGRVVNLVDLSGLRMLAGG